MKAENQEKRIKLLICFGLVVLTFAAYSPILHNGFVNYDDDVYITENPSVTSGITKDSIVWAFTESHSFMWHPLTTLSHMLDYQFFGLKAPWHHFVNLLFHIINALFVFWIFSNLTGTIWPIAFIAAVFALHPVQVESVAWAAERKTVLSGLFWFLTIAVYLWYTKRPGIERYILLFLMYGLCIMTKPVVVTLPFVLLLMDYWPLERVKWDYNRQTSNPKPVPLKISAPLLIAEKVPLFLLSGILAIITMTSQQSGNVVASLEVMPLELRISNIFLSYIKYIGKFVWPSGLAVIYPLYHLNLTDIAVIISILLFALVTVFCIYIGRRRKYVAVGWLWFIGTLVPMIGLVQSGAQSMANRYMYIPILGLLIAAVFSMKEIAADRVRRKFIAAVSAGIILLVLVILTRMQVKHWHDDFTLFGYAIDVTKNNIIAERNFGISLYKAGRLNDAAKHLAKVTQTSPTFYEARNDLGKVYLKLGRLNDAIECFNEVIKQKQDSPKGYVNLAVAYYQQGNYDLALQNCSKAEKLKLNEVEMLNNLAWLLATVGNLSAGDANKAMDYARRACEMTAYKSADNLDTLAVAYAAMGKFNDAVNTAQKALNIAKNKGQENTAREIEKRLALYKAGKPYRER